MSAQKARIRVGCLLLALLAPKAAQAASFDCSKVITSLDTSPDEKAICIDEHLSALDDLLGKAYANVRGKIGEDARWRARNFLADRRQCFAKQSCIATAYFNALQMYEMLGSGVSLPAWAYSYGAEVGAEPLLTGACARTAITEISGRLQGDTDFSSGTSVEFYNGTRQVSYDRENAIVVSRPGDKVLQCLISLPENCPPGDLRGKTYTVTNLRTQQSWTLPDAQHTCGGA